MAEKANGSGRRGSRANRFRSVAGADRVHQVPGLRLGSAADLATGYAGAHTRALHHDLVSLPRLRRHFENKLEAAAESRSSSHRLGRDAVMSYPSFPLITTCPRWLVSIDPLYMGVNLPSPGANAFSAIVGGLGACPARQRR